MEIYFLRYKVKLWSTDKITTRVYIARNQAIANAFKERFNGHVTTYGESYLIHI